MTTALVPEMIRGGFAPLREWAARRDSTRRERHEALHAANLMGWPLVEKMREEVEDRLASGIEGEQLADLLRTSQAILDEVLETFGQLAEEVKLEEGLPEFQRMARRTAEVRDRFQAMLALLNQPPPDTTKVLGVLESKTVSYDKTADTLAAWSEEA